MMYSDDTHTLVCAIDEFIHEYSYGELMSEYEYPKQFVSMEQLWLAFIMKNEYHKIWSGEDWIKA